MTQCARDCFEALLVISSKSERINSLAHLELSENLWLPDDFWKNISLLNTLAQIRFIFEVKFAQLSLT